MKKEDLDKILDANYHMEMGLLMKDDEGKAWHWGVVSKDRNGRYVLLQRVDSEYYNPMVEVRIKPSFVLKVRTWYGAEITVKDGEIKVIQGDD